MFTRRSLLQFLPAALAAPFLKAKSQPALSHTGDDSCKFPTPQPQREYTHAQLRELAKHPYARACIEEAKAEIERLCGPVRYNGLLEDMLVLDAGCLLPFRNRAHWQVTSGPAAEWIPGDWVTLMMIWPSSGEYIVPKAPSPAFQVKRPDGVRRDFTSEQLIYKPRNIVPRGFIGSLGYGVSPLEEVAELLPITNSCAHGDLIRCTPENCPTQHAIARAFGLQGNYERMLSFCNWLGEMRRAIGEEHFGPNKIVKDGVLVELTPGSRMFSDNTFSRPFLFADNGVSIYDSGIRISGNTVTGKISGCSFGA
jgi:hypothetical protein